MKCTYLYGTSDLTVNFKVYPPIHIANLYGTSDLTVNFKLYIHIANLYGTSDLTVNLKLYPPGGGHSPPLNLEFFVPIFRIASQ